MDAVLAILTETIWDASLSVVLGPRDALYSLLRVNMPDTRMGCSPQDVALAAGLKAGNANGGNTDEPEGFESYGTLARDAGY
jgi:hypothetical protein